MIVVVMVRVQRWCGKRFRFTIFQRHQNNKRQKTIFVIIIRPVRRRGFNEFTIVFVTRRVGVTEEGETDCQRANQDITQDTEKYLKIAKIRHREKMVGAEFLCHLSQKPQSGYANLSVITITQGERFQIQKLFVVPFSNLRRQANLEEEQILSSVWRDRVEKVLL